jgi:hypothetical protein
MPASEPLFCFTSNKIEMHPCPNCRAPMMISRINSTRSDLDARSFECFNCDNVVMIPGDQSEVSL